MILRLAWTCRSGWGVGTVLAAGWVPHPVKSTTRTPTVSSAMLMNAKNEGRVVLCVENIVFPPLTGSCFPCDLSVRVEQRIPDRSLKAITAGSKSLTIPSQWEREACLLSQSEHEEQESAHYALSSNW